jgi:hypothetical protein
MQKTLDIKLANILSDSMCGDFILADAKDADMGGGVGAAGVDRETGAPRSMSWYRQAMRDVTAQGLVDIMLISASTNEVLTIEERLFDDSPVTPAARANDTTDIWMASSAAYAQSPSRPFRTASIEHIQHGRLEARFDDEVSGADLGLYSITFNNDIDHDVAALEEYSRFREEAELVGFRHFLEVFAPNALTHPVEDVGRYVNDCIARALAGVTKRGRPLFLKIPYFGPEAMEQLASYDSSIIPGILGGPSGTTHDAFAMLADAKKYGARAALFGRKINNAEHQLAIVRMLREIADGNLPAREAVRAYHGELEKLRIAPFRTLEEDLVLTQL